MKDIFFEYISEYFLWSLCFGFIPISCKQYECFILSLSLKLIVFPNIIFLIAGILSTLSDILLISRIRIFYYYSLVLLVFKMLIFLSSVCGFSCSSLKDSSSGWNYSVLLIIWIFDEGGGDIPKEMVYSLFSHFIVLVQFRLEKDCCWQLAVNLEVKCL